MQTKARVTARVDEELKHESESYEVEELPFDEMLILMDNGRVVLRKLEDWEIDNFH